MVLSIGQSPVSQADLGRKGIARRRKILQLYRDSNGKVRSGNKKLFDIVGDQSSEEMVEEGESAKSATGHIARSLVIHAKSAS